MFYVFTSSAATARAFSFFNESANFAASSRAAKKKIWFISICQKKMQIICVYMHRAVVSSHRTTHSIDRFDPIFYLKNNIVMWVHEKEKKWGKPGAKLVRPLHRRRHLQPRVPTPQTQPIYIAFRLYNSETRERERERGENRAKTNRCLCEFGRSRFAFGAQCDNGGVKLGISCS